MIRITLSIFLFGACLAIYRDVDLCILENDKNWFMPDDNFDPHSLLINRKFMEAEDDEEYITYSLYTRMNPTTPQILLYEDDNSLTNSNFDARNVTVFLIHGWLGNGNSTMNTLLIKAFLQSATVNVIVVDWGYFANLNYVSSLLSVSKVGVDVGKFIRWLVGRGLSYENMHVVGFSLGSHIAGTAGKKTDSRIRRITALDPAGVLWFFLPHRIDKTDAQYVEVIHTNTKLFGYKGPCGHADFYPNGGAFMPNCWLNMCSHSMSYRYMAETVKHNDVMGHSCDHLSNIDEDNCSDAKYPMGNNELSKNISGLFRLNILFEKQIISYLRNGPPDVYDKELCY